MFIGLLCWTAIGLLVGFIGSRVVNLQDEDPKLGILIGGAGGVVGGGIVNVIKVAGAAGFNLWSLLFAAITAIVALVVWHGFRMYAGPSGSKTFRRSN